MQALKVQGMHGWISRWKRVKRDFAESGSETEIVVGKERP